MADNKGYVYAMINPLYEGLVKIGKTTKDPEIRAKELSSSTGVATPFIVVYKRLFNDCHSAEKLAHSLLTDKGYRVNNNREFFKMPINIAIDTIINLPENQTSLIDNEVEDKETDENLYYELARNFHYGFNDSIIDYDKALQNYNKALQFEEFEDCKKEIWEAMSDIYEEQGKLQPAIDCMLNALNEHTIYCKKYGEEESCINHYVIYSTIYCRLCELYSRSKKVEDRHNSEKMWRLFFDCGRNIDVSDNNIIMSDYTADCITNKQSDAESYAKECIYMLQLITIKHKTIFDIRGVYDVLVKFKVLIIQKLQVKINEWERIGASSLKQECITTLNFLNRLYNSVIIK